MKRFIILAAALLCAVTANAQQLKTAQGITIETYAPALEPEPKKVFFDKIFAKDQYTGFEQSVSLCFATELTDAGVVIDLHYMAGYRFNSYLRAGGGIGFGIIDGGDLTLPLYANIRGYFTKSRLKPFMDISIGYDISFGEFYLHPNFGADFRINDKLSCYLSVGYRLDGYFDDCLSINLGFTF